MRKLRRISLFVVLIAGLMSTFSCNSCQSRREVTPTQSYSKVSPDFNADSAYHFIQTQVDFGPRIPGTAQHESCGDFLVAKLESYGATVFEQRANLTHYDGKNLPMRNIIGSWSPDVEKGCYFLPIGIHDPLPMKKLTPSDKSSLFWVPTMLPVEWGTAGNCTTVTATTSVNRS